MGTEPQYWNLSATRRCRRLGHRWVAIDGLWRCVRYGCEAWYDPQAPLTVQWMADEFFTDLPPDGPIRDTRWPM